MPLYPASTLLQVSGVRSTRVSLLLSPEINNLNHTRAGNVRLDLRPHQSLPASTLACALCIKSEETEGLPDNENSKDSAT